MEIQEFKRILDIGLGRAILHLQQRDAALNRDVILDACLHNSTYDVQVENRGIEYLLEVIQLTNDEEFYRNQILARLSDPAPLEDYDEYQLFNFATHFAQSGDEQARQIVYSRFVANVTADSAVGARNIIELDGIDGFVFVVNQLGEEAFGDEEIWHYDSLIWDLEDRLGEEAARPALENAAINNPNLQTIISIVDEHRALRKTEKSPHPTHITYEQIKQWIADPAIREKPPISWSTWGKYADDMAIQQAAGDLLEETDDARLIAYLRLFHHQRFPFGSQHLIDLVRKHEQVDVREPSGRLTLPAQIVTAALIALKDTVDPDVRALALSLIKSPKWDHWATGLLVSNFQKGDWQLLESLFSNELDRDRHHWLGLSVTHIFEANPSEDAVPLLKYLYETSPCSNCRRHYVEYLHGLNALPDWMLEECKYDANLDLREAARRNFQKEPEKL